MIRVKKGKCATPTNDETKNSVNIFPNYYYKNLNADHVDTWMHQKCIPLSFPRGYLNFLIVPTVSNQTKN